MTSRATGWRSINTAARQHRFFLTVLIAMGVIAALMLTQLMTTMLVPRGE